MANKKLSYAPKVLDLILYAGDGASFRMTITDPDGEAIPLTGTMKAQIRPTHGAADPADAEFDIDMTDFEDGIIVLSITGEATQVLAPETVYSGVWDLEWTATDAEPMTLCQGSVECQPDVSR